MTLTGSCLCGSVAYTSEAGPVLTNLCHCLNCQKWSGSAFSPNAIVPRATFKVAKGSPAFYIPQDIPGNRFFFCATCGSSLYVEPGRLLDKIVIKAGSLDGPASSLRNKIDLETFTKDRVSYLCPIDGAKQETTFP